jgi:hypothetical protein
VSKFDDTQKFIDTHLENRRQALNNQEVSRWSTSPYYSYSEMMEVFDRAEANEKASELYGLEKTGATGADVAAQMGYRMMIHFMASVHRAARMKFASGTEDNQRSSTDTLRFVYMDKRLAQAVLERTHDFINKKAGVEEGSEAGE